MKKNFLIPLGIIAAIITYFLITAAQEEPIDYNTHIRPIFNAQCLGCHGGVKKSGSFSLLTSSEAFEPNESGLPAIIPGNPDSSELIRRLLHHDPEYRMPLEADPVSQRDVALIRRWIQEGAKWKDHWAFIKPDEDIQAPSLSESWIKNGIDAFVLKKLDKQGLSPSPQAEPHKLLRRLSLDLIGLPPTQEEVEKFSQNPSDQAYEILVDKYLNSPHFGERWAAMWLDLARYGDSQGYQKDRARNIWRYRDWVIEAFNRDMPFDQFTTEQLAGDLLESPDDNQLLATAFHRNTMSNDEGGTDDEEFRVAAVIDRVNTTFEIWQGLTIGCVQCHSHPYDPLFHEEFYKIYAFFNTSADADRTDEYPTKVLYSNAQKVEAEKLKDWLQAHASDTLEVGTDSSSIKRYWKKQKELARIRPGKTPVMQELPSDSTRVTRIFERGNWLVHGDTVQPDVPASLNPFLDEMPKNRLGLAQWLLHPDNPLTTRVIVNRFWDQLFGIGLVETLEDFGSQGYKPSHPEMLDWLAIQFRTTHNWSVKSLLRQIVMSSTYRQSSTASLELYEQDPANRLLARGPRIRLTAEQIRDQSLAVSGLLSDKMYGPSVMPPQPEGVWQVIRGVLKWRPSKGEDRYRRGIYTFWRKSSPYPSMTTFDTPSREFCISRRISTNTPLQALVTLNDSTYMEAALNLARRSITHAGNTDSDKINYTYKQVLFREPELDQYQALESFYQKTLNFYRNNPKEADALIPDSLQASPELAAYVNLANVIMNLDEFIMKE